MPLKTLWWPSRSQTQSDWRARANRATLAPMADILKPIYSVVIRPCRSRASTGTIIAVAALSPGPVEKRARAREHGGPVNLKAFQNQQGRDGALAGNMECCRSHASHRGLTSELGGLEWSASKTARSTS